MKFKAVRLGVDFTRTDLFAMKPGDFMETKET